MCGLFAYIKNNTDNTNNTDYLVWLAGWTDHEFDDAGSELVADAEEIEDQVLEGRDNVIAGIIVRFRIIPWPVVLAEDVLV